MNSKPLMARFTAKFIITDAGCWQWTASRSGRAQYGSFHALGEHRAHRVSWRLFRGDIPEGVDVCHRCDNPACVNPNHLWLGTHSDNMRDMFAKGRMIRRHWKAVCKRGHARTPKNLIGNECRECRRLRQRVEYRKES